MKTTTSFSVVIPRTLLFFALALIMVFSPLAPAAKAHPSAQEPVDRPVVVVANYSFGDDEYINPGETFSLNLRLENSGQTTARNVVATFTSGEIVPLETGGSVAVGDIGAGQSKDFDQPVTATWDVWGKVVASLPMTVSYSDDVGNIYSQAFDVTFQVWTYYTSSTATPTPTISVSTERPQIIISDYSTDVEILEPGVQFSLDLEVKNTGTVLAKRVTMIVGGGSSSGTDADGTPVPGGTSGGGGDFSKFAPLGTSNIQALGDFEPNQVGSASQPLIVNVSAEPGAYSFRISFSYVDERGRIYNDDQVVTLLVYSIPKLDIDFYMDPGFFQAGMPSNLPLQVVNTGKKAIVLGNMRVTAENADVQNNVTLVGYLDAGQYYPLDAMLTPYAAGPLDLVITVNYTDDFNQPQQIVKTLTVEVSEAPMFEPPTDGGLDPGTNGGEPFPTVEETLWQKIVRFIKGLFGLGSETTTPTTPGEVPIEGFPSENSAPLKGP